MSINSVPAAATIGVEPIDNVRDWLSSRAPADHLDEYAIVRREGTRIAAVFTPVGSRSELEAQAAIIARTWAATVVPTIGGGQ